MERSLRQIILGRLSRSLGSGKEQLDYGLYSMVRPWLFRLEPERAHHLTLFMLQLAGNTLPGQALLRAIFPAPELEAPVQAFGLAFKNPVGLAAGYDKNGLAWRGLGLLGFGHVEIGTVTPLPQPGNPQPRVFRLVDDEALVNRMGFPSQGAAAVARRLCGPRPEGLILGVNIGKNKDTPLNRAAEDYVSLLHTFAPLADYLAINVSSPNTSGLRDLQAYASLAELLSELARERLVLQAELHKRIPILVKLSPDLSSDQLDGSLKAILECGMDGVILNNTTLRRKALSSPSRVETGGLSGLPLQERTLELIRTVSHRTAGRLPIVASGGIMDASSAQRMLDAGASLVQLYTGLVYSGPGLVNQVVTGISHPLNHPDSTASPVIKYR